MTSGELQQQIFKAIKRKSGENFSMAEEVAKLLDISIDSAYRRIRGEKTILLDELYTLCRHYHISLDQLMDVNAGSVIFQAQYLNKENFRFKDYITSVIQNMAYMNSCREKEFFYMCKDLPFFHHYHIQEIAAFKWFFWLKTYFQFPEFEQKKFRFADHPDDLFELEQKALHLYNQVPSVEIWNLESMNIFLRQIEFYQQAQIFESTKDVYRLYEAIEKLWSHLEQQASLGYKFKYGDTEKKPMGKFRMYFNEVFIGDNNTMALVDGEKISYVAHTTINFMMTRDPAFNENMYNHIHNQMKRSTLISDVSEKERNRFFRIIRNKITHHKEKASL